MPRITEGITSEVVFALECQDYIFHVLNWTEQRLAVFRKDEFDEFLQGGEVIAFHKETHSGCDVMMEGEEKIMTFMHDTLPFDEYAEFEKWMLSRT